jgi:hypothetical protein
MNEKNEKMEGEKMERRKEWENIYFSRDVKIGYGKELGWYVEIEFSKKGKKEVIRGIVDEKHLERVLEACRGVLMMNEMRKREKVEKEEGEIDII